MADTTDQTTSASTATGGTRVRPTLPARQHDRTNGATRAEVRELFARLSSARADGGERAALRARLVELNTPLVRFLVRRFPASKEPVEDLVQVGMIGLLKAIDRFQLDRGVEFSTYAVPTILGEIRRYFRDCTWAVHVPRGTRDLHSSIVRARGALTQELGRAPTVSDVAARVHATESAVLEALQAGEAYTSGSLDAVADATGDSHHSMFAAPDKRLDQVEWRADLRPAISKLPTIQRRALALRFGGDQTQAQIASVLGISQMQVSRLLSRAMAMLRTELNAGSSIGGVEVVAPRSRRAGRRSGQAVGV